MLSVGSLCMCCCVREKLLLFVFNGLVVILVLQFMVVLYEWNNIILVVLKFIYLLMLILCTCVVGLAKSFYLLFFNGILVLVVLQWTENNKLKLVLGKKRQLCHCIDFFFLFLRTRYWTSFDQNFTYWTVYRVMYWLFLYGVAY